MSIRPLSSMSPLGLLAQLGLLALLGLFVGGSNVQQQTSSANTSRASLKSSGGAYIVRTILARTFTPGSKRSIFKSGSTCRTVPQSRLVQYRFRLVRGGRRQQSATNGGNRRQTARIGKIGHPHGDIAFALNNPLERFCHPPT